MRTYVRSNYLFSQKCSEDNSFLFFSRYVFGFLATLMPFAEIFRLT
uniref:Uncharacterized protein n=1 Tax=Ascaris lumbricoides TaxID=6252 RepID=A0A0M3IVZ4_ASCLU